MQKRMRDKKLQNVKILFILFKTNTGNWERSWESCFMPFVQCHQQKERKNNVDDDGGASTDGQYQNSRTL